MENQFTQIRDYFQAIAESYVPISHNTQDKRFFENITDEIKDPKPGCIMYLSPLAADMLEQDGSQIVNIEIRISILRNFERQNWGDMHEQIRATFNDCKEVLAKMRAERSDDTSANKCLLNSMDLDNTRIGVDRTVRDSWIGCTLVVNLRIDEYFEITADQWQ